jgi:HEPN domain-containing protein
MDRDFMPRRVDDWFRQAEKDLKHAENSIEDGDYEWSCFATQQAAEKALKAVYEEKNMAIKGHSILGLLKGLSSYYEVPERFYPYARILSRYYIETRYPNGFPEGSPSDYFDEDMAREAIDAAEAILKWCRDIIGR